MTQLQKIYKADITKPKRRSKSYDWDLGYLVFGDLDLPVKDKEEERIKARERYHAKKKKQSGFDPGKGRLMQLNNSLQNHR